MKNILLPIFFLVMTTTGMIAQSFQSDRLPLGDNSRKYNFCSVKLDKIFNTQTNTESSFDAMINDLMQQRIVMIGETHTNQNHHDLQFEIIKGLVEAGKPVVLALEMYNPSQNEKLAAWSSGETDPTTFMEQTDYLKTWGHNYRYYQAIFDYARAKKLPLYGANVDRKYASKIGREGLSSLTCEEVQMLPHIDTSTIEHKFLIKVLMEGMDATMPGLFANMYPAQSLWDCAMGEGAIKAAHKHPDATVVVLAGSGHVIYNLGIGRVIKDRSNLSFASVVPVDIEANDEDKDQPGAHGMGMMDNSPNRIVVRSYADYLWGKSKMEQEKYPSLGISLSDITEGGFPVKSIFPGTIAYEYGLRSGDIILTIDGKSFSDLTAIKKYLQYKNWDDQISIHFKRGEEISDLAFEIKPLE